MKKVRNIYLDVLITADDTSLIGTLCHTFFGRANNIINNVRLNTTLNYELSLFIEKNI